MKVSYLSASLGLIALAAAQKPGSPAAKNGTVLSVFMFRNECDRTSLIRADHSAGNKFGNGGAIMCYEDGMYYFNKYFREESALKIYGSPQIYNDIQIDVEVPLVTNSLQPDMQYLSTLSATAFMQGVFRPVTLTSSVDDPDNVQPQDNSTYANGPLNGYQYVPIVTVGENDPQFIWIGGKKVACPTRQDAYALYYASEDYQKMYQESLPFYESLYEPYFQGVFEDYSMVFFNAWLLYDYVEQNRLNGNETLLAMPAADVQRLRTYASHLEFNLYANASTATNLDWAAPYNGDNFREMGGRALAGKLAKYLRDYIAMKGKFDKFTAIVSTHDIMLSFFAIANLTSRSNDFFGLPELGSSMVFELYTDDPTLKTDGEIAEDSIKIAFGFRNGTVKNDDTLNYWPLFDSEPEDGIVSMELGDFLIKLDQVAIRDTASWCSVCQSQASWCVSTTGSDNTDGDGDDNESSGATTAPHSNAMHPAIAGIIGAIIMLALVGIAGAVLFFLFGFGVKRDHRRNSVLSRRGSLGRSAPEKMNSDIELPLSPTAQPMAGRFDDEDDRIYDTVSSAGTKVASPLASPEEAHFKAWDSRL